MFWNLLSAFAVFLFLATILAYLAVRSDASHYAGVWVRFFVGCATLIASVGVHVLFTNGASYAVLIAVVPLILVDLSIASIARNGMHRTEKKWVQCAEQYVVVSFWLVVIAQFVVLSAAYFHASASLLSLACTVAVALAVDVYVFIALAVTARSLEDASTSKLTPL